METKALVEAKDLTKRFLVRNSPIAASRRYLMAVDHVNLTVFPNETMGLVGESGCGKSTLGRAILQLIRPTSGEVWFRGKDIVGASPQELRRLRNEMQIIFQDPYASLNPRKTILEAVMAPLNVQRIGDKKDRLAIAEELLHEVGISSQQMHKYPHEMSGGQRQRAMIARAVILNPSFVVCDEAVSALDVSIRSQVLNLLNHIQQERKLSYLFISHDLSVVRFLCDRVAVMYLGSIVEEGTSDEIFDHPQHPYTQALISAAPIPDVTKKTQRIVLEGDVPNPMELPQGCRFCTRCRYASEKCRTVRPELMNVSGSHKAACHRI